jgi:hypothetical protein
MSLGKVISPRRTVVAAVVLVAVLALVFWWYSGRADATPETVEGWAMPNAPGDAVVLYDSPDPTGAGVGYIIAGAMWSETDNVWHQGSDSPTCVGTDTTVRKHVQLGVVHVDADHSSWTHVVWLRCL